MKPLITALLLTAGSVQVYGQTETVRMDTIKTVDQDKYRVTTNHFWDNWFIGAGAGVQHYFGDHNKQMKFSETLSPNFSAYFGKWFTPGIGARVGASGFKIVGVTQNGAHSTGERYDGKPWDGYWLYNKEFNYFHLNGDVLFNLTNIFGGYRPDRFYEISPYAGLGWMVTNDEPKAKEVSANLGIYNTFRLTNALQLTLDVRGSLVNDRFDGELGGRKNEGSLAAQIGLVYKFPKRDWDKSTETVIRYDQQVLDRLRDQVNKLAADNDALRRQLAESKNEVITDVKVHDRVLAAPILMTFPINKSTVSNEARTNLGFFAKVIKAGSPEVVYKVTGYADKGTGSPQTNERLSRERAQAIYNVLTREFDVNPNQLKVDYKGGVDNMFYDDPRLSRAVITIAE
ncbi:OmpA family protein [Sphingobacterium ginsenosidimutans]|uniref:OmpA family protein n=1 Tax=Sphingobacterium ginsenosidimutans TaxID=687845 RepID=A0ABP7ZQM4_9SPHI